MKRNARVGSAVVAGVVVAVVALIAGTAPASATVPMTYETALRAGQVLHAGETILAAGTQYSVGMTSDGDLVEYGNGHLLWSSGTSGNPGAFFDMQKDGNAVVYSATSKPLWSSRTNAAGDTAGAAEVTADGNFFVTGVGGAVKWQNGAPGSNVLESVASSGNILYEGQYLHSGSSRLIMQSDGNLVAYRSGKAVWWTGTGGHPGALVTLQVDGNLVVYPTGSPRALWQSATNGSGANDKVTLSSDGAVTMTKGSTVLWRAP